MKIESYHSTRLITGHLQSHLWSCLATKSLYQGSGYVLFHYYGQFIYITVICNSCTLVVSTLSTTNSLFSIVTLYLSWTLFVTCSPFYLFLYSISISISDLSYRYFSSNIKLVLPQPSFSKSYSKNNSDAISNHHSEILGQEPERGTAHKLKLKSLLTSSRSGLDIQGSQSYL